MLVSFPLSHWDKIFGLYYHSLLIHGPVQYEIVCLRSVNTEANEHMFNSVKVVADQCTNRHPDNVVTKVLLHVQSKQIENSLIGSEGSLQNQDNRVSKESNFLPCYKGTVIPDNYIESRKSIGTNFQLLDTGTWCMVGERQWYSCVQRW